MKYKKMARVNEMIALAQSLSVDYRASTFGISILTKDTAKFFTTDEIYLNNKGCVKYIKRVAHPSLQTKLM